jgi:peptidoglycan/LPS O-acetylase OafA/YrhL
MSAVGNRVGHVRGLNGLRALAVILVFLSHKAHVSVVDVGKLGVWIFFYISGFLIIGELHRGRRRIEQNLACAPATIGVFFVKRILRILPVYYLLLIALTIAHHLFYQRDVDLGLTWHFLFLSDYWIGVDLDHWPGTVSHFWSLAVEQQFYLIAPFVLALTRASRHAVLCAAAVVVAALGHFALRASGAGAPLIYAFSPWNFALLALGGLCAMIDADGPLAPLVRSTVLLLGGLAGIAAFLSQPLWAPAASPLEVAWVDMGLSVSLGAVFVWIVHRQQSLVVAALELRPLAYLGTISYGFYLFHNLVPSELGRAAAFYATLHLPGAAQLMVPLVLQFLLPVLLAHLSWRLVEMRVLEFKAPLEAAIRSRLPVQGRSRPQAN